MSMRVLVAYASRHGATKGIAERIASGLTSAGLEVTVESADRVRDPGTYDAYVIGSAAYLFHWMKEATEFVRHNRKLLASGPVWLFSSGPTGTDLVDEDGRDVREAAIPREFAEFQEAIHPRGTQVFFGAYDPTQKPIGLAERLGDVFLKRMPAAREAIPAGDFRDWDHIDAWTRQIASELALVGTPL